MSKLELVLSVIVSFQALCTLLAHALPAGSKSQRFFARAGVYLGKAEALLPAPPKEEAKP